MYFSATNHKEEIGRLLDNSKFGDYKFIYLSPERIQNEAFLEQLTMLTVNCIAVDEAHCISEWGIDFRPAYRKIKHLQERFPNAPNIALTATATAKVRNDIIEIDISNSTISGQVDATTSSSSSATTSTSSAVTSASTSSSYISSSSSSSGY